MERSSPIVRHAILPEEWPTAEQAAKARWFEPIAIGQSLIAQTRTWVPAMVPWRAKETGEVTQEVLDWYGRFAEGVPGVLVVEATGIRDVPSGPLLRIGDDRFIPGLRALTDVVRKRSNGRTRLFIQLIDFLSIRRRPEPERYFMRFLALQNDHREKLAAQTNDRSWLECDELEVRQKLLALFLANDASLESILAAREREELDYGARERVTDCEKPHIRDLPQVLPDLFSAAAVRAKAAGFDGVELHYAHAYTMASFLSAKNDRKDGYGGSPEARVRLPLEVFRRVRASVGAEFAVGCRYLGDEAIENGSTIDDAVYYGVAFARAGMDFLSLSKGGKFDDAKQPKIGEAAYPYTGHSGHECMPTVRSDQRGPFGRNLHLAHAVRAAVRAAGLTTPVVAAGGINGFHLAEEALARGDADIVASARQTLADPDWFEKVRTGRGDEVRRCKLTNYCEALDQRHKMVTCQLWDRVVLPDENPDLLAMQEGRRLIPPAWLRR